MKKFFISAAVVAAAVCGVFTANQVNNEVAMNDLQLENVEALASGESMITKNAWVPVGSWGYALPDGHYCQNTLNTCISGGTADCVLGSNMISQVIV